MAIIAPADLPSVLKVRSEPMKKYVLSKLGFPVIATEITEDQWEVIFKVAGDFIAGYFPREQRLALFWTTPLQSTYPLPQDAYWINEVSWDPVTTRIDDVFGAESFLFCVPGGTHLLTDDGPMPCEEAADKNINLITPYGKFKPRMKWNKARQPVQVLQTMHDYAVCTPNHPIHINDKFRMAVEGFPGTALTNESLDKAEIVDRDRVYTDGTWSISVECGCYFASALGKEFYLVH